MPLRRPARRARSARRRRSSDWSTTTGRGRGERSPDRAPGGPPRPGRPPTSGAAPAQALKRANAHPALSTHKARGTQHRCELQHAARQLGTIGAGPGEGPRRQGGHVGCAVGHPGHHPPRGRPGSASPWAIATEATAVSTANARSLRSGSSKPSGSASTSSGSGRSIWPATKGTRCPHLRRPRQSPATSGRLSEAATPRRQRGDGNRFPAPGARPSPTTPVGHLGTWSTMRVAPREGAHGGPGRRV